MARPLLARFTAGFIPEPMSGCWLWLKSVDRWGYGKFGVDYRQPGAHRVAWQLFRGAIPEGLLVLHRCDVPSCVNPHHLFLGSNMDNIKDSARKGRRGRKLTAGTVIAIRADRAAGVTWSALAVKYGLSASTVHGILSGKAWRYAQPNP